MQKFLAPPASYQVLSTPGAGFTLDATAVAANAALPYNALEAGTDTNGAAIYECTAPYDGGNHPGKTEAGWGSCDISYGGREIWIAGSYTVLTPQFGQPVGNTFVAGTDTNGAPLGICSAPYWLGIQVGKWFQKTTAEGVCDFPYGQSEIALQSGFNVFEGEAPPP